MDNQTSSNTAPASTAHDNTSDTSITSSNHTVATEGRFHLVRGAFQGLQRFKESWLSAVLLKGTIGLGQVVVMITLLALASHRSSPQYPDQKQTEPSDACPHPQHFVKWMTAQIFRLTLCWIVSVYVCYQKRSFSNGNDSAEMDVESGPVMTTTHVPLSLTHAHPTQPGPPSSRSSIDVAMLNSPPSRSVTLFDEYITRHDLVLPDLSSTLTRSNEVYSNTDHPASRPPAHHKNDNRRSSSSSQLPVEQQVHNLRQPTTTVTRFTTASSSPSHRTRNSTEEESELEDSDEPRSQSDSRVCSLIDTAASHIQKLLALISFILFILGNVFVFHPHPHAPGGSCYTASPLLWWGVMAVTGVGWFLLAQMVIVMVVVGFGGHVVLALLRSIGIVAPLPSPPPPVTAERPLPLTRREIKRHLPLVAYMPSSPTASNEHLSESKHAHKVVVLDKQHAICAICQENYLAGNLEKKDNLRLLPCGHVYHHGCVDKWLLKTAGDCPTCRGCVRTMVAGVGQ